MEGTADQKWRSGAWVWGRGGWGEQNRRTTAMRSREKGESQRGEHLPASLSTSVQSPGLTGQREGAS